MLKWGKLWTQKGDKVQVMAGLPRQSLNFECGDICSVKLTHTRNIFHLAAKCLKLGEK